MQPQHTQRMMDVIHYIATKARNVSINIKGVTDIVTEAMTYMVHNYENNNFDQVAYNYVRLSNEYHPIKEDYRAPDWLFVLNTLNFSLWSRNDKQNWKVDGLTGYMALCAAIKRAIDDGKPLWDPKFYSKITFKEMMHIFRGDNGKTIPRIYRRLILLRKIGEILLKDYNGTFADCIRSCNHDVVQFVNTIKNKFPSYYTPPVKYDGQLVSISSKIWTLVNDIWAFFHTDEELGLDITIRKLPTIFADYRVPQVLKHFNALVYSKEFLDKFKNGDKLLGFPSKEELEIRCCSFMIMRYLESKMKQRCECFAEKSMPELQSPGFDYVCLLDNFMWDYRQAHDAELKKIVLFKVDS